MYLLPQPQQVAAATCSTDHSASCLGADISLSTLIVEHSIVMIRLKRTPLEANMLEQPVH